MSTSRPSVQSLAFFALLFTPAGASAAMMPHYDLAGLVVQSESIVVAERIASHERTSQYRVTRTLRGPLQASAELELYDSLYDVTGHSTDAGVFLFLAREPDGKRYLVSSGMRVVEHGHVFRFEQLRNPGGFTMVPQGRDPQDNWQAGVTAVDVPTFEHSLVVATKRVDDLAAALNQPDATTRRAAVLAQLPQPGTRAPSSGFYSDFLVLQAEKALADTGDLEGALLASLRDHSAIAHASFGKLPDLIAVSQDAARPVDQRVAAILALENHIDYFGSAVAVRTMIALVADPLPQLRSAAIAALSHVGDWSTSDAKAQAEVARLTRETRAALDARFALEQDNDVLFALAASLHDRPLPARHGGPETAARAHIERSYVNVEVRCLQSGKRFADGKVTATRDGTAVPIAGFNVSWSCGHGGEATASAAPDAPFPAGNYQTAVEMKVDRKSVAIPLGTLTSDGKGEMTLDTSRH